MAMGRWIWKNSNSSLKRMLKKAKMHIKKYWNISKNKSYKSK